jgi:uracil-DNA glycosylase
MEPKKVNIEELQEKLYKRLLVSGWGDKLKGFLLSNDFVKILEVLVDDVYQGKHFVPTLKLVFRALEECHYKDTRVIMLGQDPYPSGVGIADGLAFSCGLTGKPQPSLHYMSEEIRRTVYPNQRYVLDPDLKRWADQGILLLNTALTVILRQPGTHYLLWRPFLVYLIDTIIWNPEMSHVVWVFMGSKAKEYTDTVPDNFHKLEVVHPAAAAHSNAEKWNSNDLFNKINEKIKGEKIIW